MAVLKNSKQGQALSPQQLAIRQNQNQNQLQHPPQQHHKPNPTSSPTTQNRIECRGKRTTSVTVKMSAEDYALLEKAADALWPGALLSRSSIVLGLGRMGADAVLKKSGGRPL